MAESQRPSKPAAPEEAGAEGAGWTLAQTSLVDGGQYKAFRAAPMPHAVEALALVPGLARVEPGALVLKPSGQGPETKVTCGPGVKEDKAAGGYVATQRGCVAFVDGRLEVLTVIFDAAVAVEVDKDRMGVKLTVYPHVADGAALDVDGIRKILLDKGVKRGYLEGDWEQALKAAESSRRKVILKAAAGQPPRQGANARIEVLVDLEPGTRPQPAGDGQVDFKNLSLVKQVAAGQPIARRHPPQDGIPGFLVTGEELPAKPGNDAQFQSGEGLEPSPQDPNLLVAKWGGNLKRQGGLLTVQECLRIEGDVDYATGNIQYERTVNVKGDVKAGFTVATQGDIEIGGSVEDATLKAGGSILIKGGFIGEGHGELEAKVDISLGFADNQLVRAYRKLTVAKEAMNCRLRARDMIEVHGVLCGGTALAGREIVCQTVGNHMGARTELEAGTDFVQLENLSRIEDKAKEWGGLFDKLARNLEKLEAMGLGHARPDSQEGKVLAELRTKKAALHAKLAELEKARNEIKAELQRMANAEGVRIKVERLARPGLRVRIGPALLKLDDELPGPRTFVYREGEIKIF